MADVPLTTDRYQIAGEGRDLFSRFDLRDRIRKGSLLPSTEVALEGSEEYRPAVEYTELARYFSLLTKEPAKATAPSSFVPAGPVGAPTSVGERLIPGLIYPVTGFGAAVVLGLTLLDLLPFGALASMIAIPLVSLAVVRVSSAGSTRMPALEAFGGPGSMAVSALKAIAISLLSAWPFIAALLLTFLTPRSGFMLFVAAAIAMVLYYPACMAILAKYGTIRPALSVSQVWGFISTLGADYALAIVAGFGVLGLGIATSFVAGEALGKVAPLVIGAIFLWGTLYVFHLIGWAMYRHRNEI